MFGEFIRKTAYRILGRLTIDDLVKRGLRVGSNCYFEEDVDIDIDHCWHVAIGNNVGIAKHVKILAHDGSMKQHIGYTRIGKVVIEDNVFIGAGTIILPNVHIGANSVIGAGSVVSRSIPANVVAAGNPARPIKNLDDFLERHREKMNVDPCFGPEFSLDQGMTKDKRDEMNRLMINGQGYVV